MSRHLLSKLPVLLSLSLAVALGASTLPPAVAQTAKAKAKAKTVKAAVKTPLDLNKATEEEMVEVLPGVGEATAKKIIAGRPYTSIDDLAKAGVPARTIAVIRPLLVIGEVPKAKAAPKAEAAPKKEMVKTAPAAPKVDLNKATAEEMVDTLPGVGAATAKKIVAGRPYTSIDDLAKAGVPARTITALREHATVSTAAPAATPAPTTTPAKTATKTVAKSATKTAAKTPTRPTSAKPININTASREELDALPGIGEVKSQAIIDARPYKTKEDIMKVKGIKEGEFSRIKDLITVD